MQRGEGGFSLVNLRQTDRGAGPLIQGFLSKRDPQRLAGKFDLLGSRALIGGRPLLGSGVETHPVLAATSRVRELIS